MNNYIVTFLHEGTFKKIETQQKMACSFFFFFFNTFRALLFSEKKVDIGQIFIHIFTFTHTHILTFTLNITQQSFNRAQLFGFHDFQRLGRNRKTQKAKIFKQILYIYIYFVPPYEIKC